LVNDKQLEAQKDSLFGCLFFTHAEHTMKTIFFHYLILSMSTILYSSLHAQTLSFSNIGKLSLSEIEQEFYLKSYPLDSTANWGMIKAKADSKKGKKNLLIHSGLLSEHCGICLAEQAGYQLISFGTNDLTIEHVDAFIRAYNETMQEPLQNNTEFQTSNSFVVPTSNNIITQSEALSDSTFHLSVKLPELEATFAAYSDFIQLEFNFVDAAFLPLKTTYETVKVKGVTLPNFKRDTLIMRLTIDLSKIPADYSKCFCKTLQQRYHLNIVISTIGMD
jgi:hypothetical protein